MQESDTTNEVPDLWDDAVAAGLDEPGLLRYRSNLLGSDLRITNFGGGNTSAKIAMSDPVTGEAVTVLWVKGSGGDLGSIGLDGFATLYQERLLALEGRYRGIEHEDEMVAAYPHVTFNLNPRPASIDTPLHAYVPEVHIDHMHPDSVIAVAASKDSERLTTAVFGGELGWLPWQRPGFDLGLRLRDVHDANPGIRGVILEGHGLITWGATSKDCYRTSLRMVNRAQLWLDRAAAETPEPFGACIVEPLGRAERKRVVTDLMPRLRGRVSFESRKVAHFCDDADVLEFVGSARLAELAALGTSCPDHFLRTKIRPLVIDPGCSIERLDALLADYRSDYAAYYERCRRDESPAMRDPNPVVILVPGAGMLTFAKDKPMARRASEFYVNAIHVMRGASLLDGYVGLPEAEAFGIEYWQLEEAKLQRMPPEKALSRRIALISGAAGGIGKACAERLLADKACVVLTDIDESGLDAARIELADRYGEDFVRHVVADVTNEAQVLEAVRYATREYGGLDIAVCSAGLASSAPVEDTTLREWQRNLDVLTTGYFLVAREAYKVMQAQGLGGSIVFISSKNALAASPNAAAYCTAKSAVLHLARCLALEGAQHGVRVNTVNPDAVLAGSKIWQGEWRAQRAAAYGLAEGELEEHYRKRSMLGLSVLPEDVAEAVHWFASDRSAKSTGNILNVDAGNAQSFPR